MKKKHYSWISAAKLLWRSKLLKTMRLALFAILVSVVQIFATDTYAQQTLVSLNVKNTSIRSVLDQIESQSDFYFIYNAKAVDVERMVSIEVENKSIPEILDKIFEGTYVTYKIDKRQIAISTNLAENAFQQETSISGRVTDSAGQPLPGVTVVVKGTTQGTITDANGNYSISKIPGNAVLVFSFVGMKAQEVAVGGRNIINIVMTEESIGLDEVVAIGYGTVKKRDLTGSVASVSADKIMESPGVALTQAIQGKVPGVLVTNSSWTPGAAPSILIRGTRSINASNDPLYVVDGIPITMAPNLIPPGDIESIDILKDASATAIYGSRGANGVILITTKKGKIGKIQVDYNGYYGPVTIQNKLELMNGSEYADYVREAYRGAGRYASDVPNMALDQTLPSFTSDDYTWQSIAMAYDENGNYDPSKVRSSAEWWKYVEQTGMVSDHQVTVRGGSEKTKFAFGTSYYRAEGIYKQQDYSRYSVKMSIDTKVNKWLKVGGQSQFTHSLQNRGTAFQNSWRVNPLGRLYDDDGALTEATSGVDTQWWNPLQYLVDGAVVNPYKVNRFLGSYYGEVVLPLKGLRFHTNVGIEYHTKQDYKFYSSLARSGNVNQASSSTADTYSYTIENLLYYDKKVNEHSFGLTLLQSVQNYKSESLAVVVEDLPSDKLLFNNLSAANTITSFDSGLSEWSLASFMGRLNYNFKGKYYATVSMRYDGSSRLADGHKWVSFPAFALAWRMNEEPFFKSIENLDNLKLRFGYGVSANTSISPYQTKGVLGQTYYSYGDNEVIGYAPGSFPDKSLAWEKTGQWNIGLDFSLFKGKVSGTVDSYLSNTEDLLLNRQLPVVSGYSSVLTNIGKTRNKGVELSLSTTNIKNHNFSWMTDMTYSFNKEEIVELYNGEEDDISNGWFIGKPINVFYDYEKIGIWQNTDEDLAEIEKFNANGHNFAPGMIKIKDLNGDYRISSDEDRKILGHKNPTHLLSLNNTITFKGFDFSIEAYATLGGMLSNNIRYNHQSYRNNAVKYKYWTSSNPTNDFPQPNMLYDNINYESSLYLEKSDFLRLKTISLGYSLPQNILSRYAISRCRLYTTIQNPIVFTGFSGVDPEGATGYASPSTTNWLLGVNLSF